MQKRPTEIEYRIAKWLAWMSILFIVASSVFTWSYVGSLDYGYLRGEAPLRDALQSLALIWSFTGPLILLVIYASWLNWALCNPPVSKYESEEVRQKLQPAKQP